MRRRIFVAINLPENIKKRLVEFKERWFDLPVRWTKKDSLHLTLVFIGYVGESGLYEVCRTVRNVAQNFEPFFLTYDKIIYGPPGHPPRMIWLLGRVNQTLAEIKQKTEESLLEIENLNSFRLERRPFSPHITLARIKNQDWGETKNLPKIEQDFKATLSVTTIDVMESDLRGDGAEYTILESCPLGE